MILSSACPFQSTRSAWSATYQSKGIPVYSTISIHALRMERDAVPHHLYLVLEEISIHALRMERDDVGGCHLIALLLFQSTRSAWSATRSAAPIMVRSHFNPRAPHGARPFSI